MSANMDEAIERQRELLYAGKSNEQLIMIALHYVLVSVSRGHDALLRELYDRYQADSATGRIRKRPTTD